MNVDNNSLKQGGFHIDYQKLFAPLALVILLAVFMIISGRQGVRLNQFAINILEAAYFVGFMAIGATFVIITGGIDLSSGTVMMCGAIIGGVAYNKWRIPIIPALSVVVLVSMAFGALNGFLVTKLKLPPFIATLGTMMIAQSVGAIVSRVQTMHYPTIASPDGWFKTVFIRTPQGFPTGIVWLSVCALIGMFLLKKTLLGKYTYAIGSNSEAARLSGINTANWLWIVYIVNGIFYAATFTSVIPGTGNGQEMQAIAGVVIGGTSLSGGTGSMAGTIIGV
ncbi:MAG: ABC transporter permease, partial [Synergistaceae bacterium]|nr:ABC transporter permease [Synergistaceae bacterium]